MIDKNKVIGVVGLGYVGLPMILQFGKAGFQTVGIDIDMDKINSLCKGESYIKHIDSADIQVLNDSGVNPWTCHLSIVKALDFIIICVPTPLGHNRDPDLSYITYTAEQIGKYLVKGKKQVVILESTTYPGTTKEVLIPILENWSGLKEGVDFFTAYSPEREDPNNKDFTVSTTPKVVGSDSAYGLEACKDLYLSIIKEVVPVSDSQTAEATKLMENIFRSVNIALVNELKTIFDKMGIDIWEVIEAAKTKPFGYMPFYPGPGLGGHCIPIDPFYLTWKAREFGISTRFIELAGEINTEMPHYVAEKALMALNDKGKSLNGSRIIILGMAYKKDVDDDRESPGFKIMSTFIKGGAIVDYNDPYIPVLGAKRDYPHCQGKSSVLLRYLKHYDVTLILTDHSSYDYKEIVEQSNIVIDTRNACAGIQSDKILKA